MAIFKKKRSFTFSLGARWVSLGTADRRHRHHHLERGWGEHLGGRATLPRRQPQDGVWGRVPTALEEVAEEGHGQKPPGWVLHGAGLPGGELGEEMAAPACSVMKLHCDVSITLHDLTAFRIGWFVSKATHKDTTDSHSELYKQSPTWTALDRLFKCVEE